MRKYIYILFIIFIATSCGVSKQPATTTDNPYQRKPIAEVEESQLKSDGKIIDATTQLLIGNNQEALEQFQQILRQEPDNATAHYELGRLYQMIGRLDSALTHMQQAVKLDGSNVWYLQRLASIYEARHDNKNHIATWETLVRNNPNVLEYYYNLSDAYLNDGNVNSSIEVLNRVEKRYGVTELVSLQKQKLWDAVGKPDKARKEIEALSDAMPNEPRYTAILAQSYMDEKNYDRALEYYKRLYAIDPANSETMLSMAFCYLTMKRYGDSYATLRKSLLNSDEECKTKLYYLSNFLSDKNFFEGYSQPCLALADTLAAQCPNVEHASLYGMMLAGQKRYKEAAAQFEQYLAFDPSQYDTWESLLICEGMVPEMEDQLLEHAAKAAELFPLHLLPYAVLAEGMLNRGNCEQARYYLERCRMVAPNDNNVKQLATKINQQCQ